MGEKHSSGGAAGVLSNHRRQLVVSQLQSHEAMSLGDLAEQIAIIDQGVDIKALTQEAVDEVEVALHHVHAPKLAEAGYVKYDSQRRMLSLTDKGRRTNVDSECARTATTSDKTVSVDLCSETVDLLHDVIRHDERFDGRMDYDSVINAVLSDARPDREAENEEAR